MLFLHLLDRPLGILGIGEGLESFQLGDLLGDRAHVQGSRGQARQARWARVHLIRRHWLGTYSNFVGADPVLTRMSAIAPSRFVSQRPCLADDTTEGTVAPQMIKEKVFF